MEQEEKKLPEGLEEAAEKAGLEYAPIIAGEALDLSGQFYETDDVDWPSRCGFINGFRAGAEWGMNQCPLPEDTTIFMKGVAEGKRLMIEEAVAVEVVGEKRDLRLIDSTQRCLFNAERGDWLKIIIVKEYGK